MAKITFCYDAEGFRTADMHIVVGDNRLTVKDGQSVETEVPAGEYQVMFKSSIRFSRLNIAVDKDIVVQVGWDAESGAPVASVKE
ncbi:MAG: hypothetical protein MJZ68_09710 [archaeon]|nr:hypothetical protein [archaeon]